MRGRTSSKIVEGERRIVLIVDDHMEVALAVRRFVPEGYEPLMAGSVAETNKLLAAHPTPVAAVVDVLLPDGSGIDIVRTLREMAPSMPVLVLTGMVTKALINEVSALGGHFVCKPDSAPSLMAFFRTLSQTAGGVHDQVARAGGRLGLTNRERDILIHSMDGVPRGRLSEVMGISENTLKKYVRSLLRKTSQSSLTESVWFVRNVILDEPDGSGRAADREKG